MTEKLFALHIKFRAPLTLFRKLLSMIHKFDSQILDALYGIEPDETNPVLKRMGLTGNLADKEKFLRRILGKKVVSFFSHCLGT